MVENRTGGGGRIGVNAVKNAAPDGLTLLFTPFAAVTIYPSCYNSLDYDPFTDLTTGRQICTFDFGSQSARIPPAKTPKELVAWLRPTPTRLSLVPPARAPFRISSG